MPINLRGIRFVRKDKTLLSNPHKIIKQEDKTGYVYEENKKGVAIIPYRMGKNGREVLIRDEYTPIHTSMLSIITGRMDADDEGWRGTAQRELLEEAGILTEPRHFSEIGEIIAGGFYKNTDILCMVDVTGLHQGKPSTDGSIFEKKSTNLWVPIHELVRMIREPHDMDSYLMSAVSTLLVCWGLINKSEEDDLFKAKKGEEKPGHKYIRREGAAGQYKYIYKEPEAKGPKKEDDKKGKGGMMEQLAALIGKKQGPSEEKKPKKLLPFQEFKAVPDGIPDFSKNTTAEQFINRLDNTAIETGIRVAGVMTAQHTETEASNKFNQMKNLAEGLSAAIRITRSTRFGAGIQEITPAKGKSERAQTEIINAITTLSNAYSQVKAVNGVLNSSLTEKIFVDLSEKITKDNFDVKKLDALISSVSDVKQFLNTTSSLLDDYKWLQGSDPRLDFMVDKIFEAVDETMKFRNRFIKNGFKFYVNQLLPKVENLGDAEELASSVKLMENFSYFISDVMRDSTVSSENANFTNQWNVKEKGMYDGAMRLHSYAAGKIVDKIRSLESIDENIMQNHLYNMAKNQSFAFLSMNMNSSLSSLDTSEKVFSYIDTHGIDKYYQDAVFAVGGFLAKGKSSEKESYQNSVELLTKAHQGVDIYNDEDSLEILGKLTGQRYNTVNTAMNTMLVMNKDVPIVSKEAAFIKIWSVASHGSLMSNALELFVDSKGIDRGSYVNYHIASNRTSYAKNVKTKDALSDATSRVYENTQKTIQDAPVTLYRGNGNSEIKSTASSWTTDPTVAEKFGSVISKVESPAQAVLLANTFENEDYWAFRGEFEYVLVPGLLSADKALKPNALSKEEVQKIKNDEIDKMAEAYEN